MSTMEDLSHLTLEEKKSLLRRLLNEKAAGSRREFPASHGQQALWFLNQFHPDSAAYNVIFAARVRSALDLAALRNAMQAVSDRHSSLRTTFADRQGQPVRVVHRSLKFPLPEIDARGWTDDQLYREVSAGAYQPFDLTTGPLFRGAVFTRAKDDHVLLFAVHHIIADFWSLVVLMSEVRQIYQAREGPQRSTAFPCRRPPTIPTTSVGKRNSWPGRKASGSGITGAGGWATTCLCSTCPPTGLIRRSKPTGAGP